MNSVLQTIQNRRSIRAFTDEIIEPGVLDEILTAGTYAASGHGRQSGQIICVRNPGDIRTLEKLNAKVLGKPDSHPFYGAKTVVVVLADPSAPTYVQDGSLILGNLMLAAASVGVGSCWINRAKEVFDSDVGKALLRKWQVNPDLVGIGHCILGYPDPTPAAAARKPGYIIKID